MNKKTGLARLIAAWLACFLLSGFLPAKAGDYEYVMKINRSALAVVESDVIASFQVTAMQDVPAMQSVVLAPELVDTLTNRKVELPLIFINSRNQQIYFDRYLKEEYPDAISVRKKKGVDLIENIKNLHEAGFSNEDIAKGLKIDISCVEKFLKK